MTPPVSAAPIAAAPAQSVKASTLAGAKESKGFSDAIEEASLEDAAPIARIIPKKIAKALVAALVAPDLRNEPIEPLPIVAAAITQPSQPLPFLLQLQFPRPEIPPGKTKPNAEQGKQDAATAAPSIPAAAIFQTNPSTPAVFTLQAPAVEKFFSAPLNPVDGSPRKEAAAPASPWKESAAPLPKAELAFAARILEPPPRGAESVNAANAMREDPRAEPHETSEPPSLPERKAPASRFEREQSPELPTAAPSKPVATPSELIPATGSQEQSQPTAAPPPNVARPAEVRAPPEPRATAPPPPIRDFSLRLTGHDQDKVEVKVVETAGQVRVAVRSTDAQLNTSLQQGLGELVGKLESRGMHADTWRPAGETAGTAALTHSDSAHNGRQQFSGDGSPGRQWRQQQQELPPPRRRNKPEWLREIDGTFDTLQIDATRRTA